MAEPILRARILAICVFAGCVLVLNPSHGAAQQAGLPFPPPSEEATLADHSEIGTAAGEGAPQTFPANAFQASPLKATPGAAEMPDLSRFIAGGPKTWTSPQGLTSALQVMLLLTVLSMAPAVLLMTTCFVRIVVVLGLLRQALGTAQLPPSQVLTSIAMFLTLLVMAPVWNDVYVQGVRPYADSQISPEEAWQRGCLPIKRFMSRQIELAGNGDDVWLFYERLPEASQGALPQTYDDVPLTALLSAFMLSELKVAFLIGFQVFLPFLILDIVVASVTISMGMLMLPPVMISLPIKLLLFVLVDGWNLVVGMLLQSIAPYG